VITHRFTIAMRADIIYVMDNGQILESGSHQELLAQVGLYAQSWERKSGNTGLQRRLPACHQPTNNTLTTCVHRHRGQRTRLLRSCLPSPLAPTTGINQFLLVYRVVHIQ